MAMDAKKMWQVWVGDIEIDAWWIFLDRPAPDRVSRG
jgi:hypothetical protein